MAYPRSRMRTNSPVQDNRRKPSAIRWKKSGKIRGGSPAKQRAQQYLSAQSPAVQLQHQQDRIDTGLGIDPELTQPPPFERLRPSGVAPVVNHASPGAGVLPPMPMRPGTAAMPSVGGLRAGVTPDVGGVMGPNAAFLLSGAPRPPIRSGWKSRFGATRPASAGGTAPSMSPYPESVRRDVEMARPAEFVDLKERRAARGLPFTMPSADEQMQGMPMPMTTHFGGSRMGVSSLPRPLDRVQAELTGQPNFERAAGPGNEAWMGANEARDTARGFRMENVHRQAAQEAAERAQRLEQRGAPISPMTALAGGLYRQGGPQAVANYALQQGRLNQFGAAQAADQQFREREFAAQQPLRQAQLESQQQQNRMMEQAMTEEADLERKIGETQDRMAAVGEETDLYDQLEDELDDLNEQLSGVRDRQAGLGGGGSLRPRTAPGGFTADDAEDWSKVLSKPSTTMPAAVGDISTLSADEAADAMSQWARDNENSPMPSDDEVETALPRLMEDPHEITVDKEFLGTRDARRQGVRLSAQPMPGDSEGDNIARVKAFMRYVQNPDRKPPTVNGYRLKVDKRESKIRFQPGAGLSPPGMGPMGIGIQEPKGYKYSWQKVK